MILGSIERYFAKDQDCKVIKHTIIPSPRYFAFCNVLYMGVPGPSLLIESTDSMIIYIIYTLLHSAHKLLIQCTCMFIHCIHTNILNFNNNIIEF